MIIEHQKKSNDESEHSSDNAKNEQNVNDTKKIEQDNNNSVWYIIFSKYLTKNITDKIHAISDITLVIDNYNNGNYIADVSEWKPQDDKNFIKVPTENLYARLKNVKYNTKFVIKKYDLESDTLPQDLYIDEVQSAVVKGANKLLLDHMFADQSAELLNEVSLQEDQINEYNEDNVSILNEREDFENNQMIFLVKVPLEFNCVVYHFNKKVNKKDSNYTKHGKIVLIGNSEKDANNPLFGHLGSLNRYSWKDVTSFAITIRETDEIYKILNDKDKQKVETIYKIDNIFKEIKKGKIGKKRLISNKYHKQKICDLILDIRSKIDNYNIDGLNQTFKKLIKDECDSWEKPDVREFILDKICKIFKCECNLYEQLGKQKQADVCRTLSEYDPSKIDQVIEKKTNERNRRWGCIMKKRINEQIAYLNKMRANPLLYNNNIIDEISERTPDSYTVSPCNFVQPWNKEENKNKDANSEYEVVDGNKVEEEIRAIQEASDNEEVVDGEEEEEYEEEIEVEEGANNEQGGNANMNNGRPDTDSNDLHPLIDIGYHNIY